MFPLCIFMLKNSTKHSNLQVLDSNTLIFIIYVNRFREKFECKSFLAWKKNLS